MSDIGDIDYGRQQDIEEAPGTLYVSLYIYEFVVSLFNLF